MEFKDFWTEEGYLEAQKKNKEIRKKTEAENPQQMVIIYFNLIGVSRDDYLITRDEFEDFVNESQNSMYFNGSEEALDGSDGYWYIDVHKVEKTFKKYIRPKLNEIDFMKGSQITFCYNTFNEDNPDKEIKQKTFVLEEFQG